MVVAFKVSDEMGDSGELFIGPLFVVRASNYRAWESAIHFYFW